MVSISQLLAPPPSSASVSSSKGVLRGGSATRPAGSPLVRRLLERLTGDSYTLGQLASVLLSTTGGSRGEPGDHEYIQSQGETEATGVPCGFRPQGFHVG